MYDPTFYIKNFLWLENNVVLTFVLIAGLPCWASSRGILLCDTAVAILLMMTKSSAACNYSLSLLYHNLF